MNSSKYIFYENYIKLIPYMELSSYLSSYQEIFKNTICFEDFTQKQ